MNISYEHCKATNGDCMSCDNRFFFMSSPQYKCQMRESIKKLEQPKIINKQLILL